MKLHCLLLFSLSFFFSNNFSFANTKEKLKIICEEQNPYCFIDDEKKEKDKDYFYTDHKDKIIGYEIDTIKKILNELQYDYEIAIIPWQKINSFLKQGMADIALGLTKNEKTEKVARLLKYPTRTKNFVFFGRMKDMTKKTLTFEEALAEGKTIGLNRGSTYPDFFWKLYPNINSKLNPKLMDNQDYEQNLRFLKKEIFDVFIGEQNKVQDLVQRVGSSEIITHYRNILYSKDYFMGVSKQSDFGKKEENIIALENKLYKLKNNAYFEELEHKWNKNLHRNYSFK